MKDQITINGIVLTRAQIEQAKEELDRPEEEPLKGGDRAIHTATGEECILLRESARIAYQKGFWGADTGCPTGISLRTGQMYTTSKFVKKEN